MGDIGLRGVWRIALLAALIVAAGPALASADIMPMEGDVFPLHEVHSNIVGHLSGMLAGPFIGPCLKPAERPVVPDEPAHFTYVGELQASVFDGAPTTLGGAVGSVSPSANCRPGFNNGSNLDIQPIYASSTGSVSAVYQHSSDHETCCGDQIGYFQTDADRAASWEDLRRADFTIVNPEPAKRFTDAEKQTYAKKSADLNVESASAGGVAATCALIPDPSLTKACAVFGGLEAAALAAMSGYYSRLSADPVDKGFRKVAKPVRLTPPSSADADMPPAVAGAYDAYAAVMARESGLGDALDTAINRSQGAHVAHDKADEARQLTAARRYAQQLAAALGDAATARANLVAALTAVGFPDVTATPADVAQAEHDNFTPDDSRGESTSNPGPGFSAEQAAQITALSPTRAVRNRARSVLVNAPTPTANVTLYGLLSENPPSDTATAAALRAFAARRR